MERTRLAARLVAADEAERAALLTEHVALVDAALAWALKAQYDDLRVSDPAAAGRAASTLATISATAQDREMQAIAAWTSGMAALHLDGQLEEGLGALNRAVDEFSALGQHLHVANVHISRLQALAMLGQYDAAIETGLRTRDVFVQHGDLLAAGKIEQNLGGIHFRRDQYQEAIQFYTSARERFIAVSDVRELTKAENNLATALTSLHEFRQAETFYETALALATSEGLEVTQAEIEGNLGSLALFQGHFDKALDFLERSRRRYVALAMSHETAKSEQELAEAYLELGMAIEAEELFTRIIPTFQALGMRAEEARAQAYYGRALLLLNQHDPARAALETARDLYIAEGNAVGEALALLTEAEVLYDEGDFAAAYDAARHAEAPFRAAGTWGRVLLARWLQGEAARQLGQTADARAILTDTLQEAETQAVPQIVHRCLTSLGLLHAAAGDRTGAEAAFKRAVEIIDGLRAPLPAEEFRTAFVADKLTPYAELVRLCLDDGGRERVVEALDYVERSRSRALVEMVSGALQPHPKPRDDFEAHLLTRLEALREELNWFYSQINRPREGGTERSAAMVAELQDAVREREAAVLELTRQLQQRSQGAVGTVEPLAFTQLQHDLGDHTALIEYFSLDDELLAFVVTDQGVNVIRPLGTEEQIAAALGQLRFQIDALRHGAARVRAHLDQLTQRARHYLHTLYDLLLQPIEPYLGQRRLLIVPHRSLHYVPFHALYDGSQYVVEGREVCFAPSASVLQFCLAQPDRPTRRALLCGVPDAQTPRVRDEVLALAPLFPHAETLLDAQVTLSTLRDRTASADILHLACHGQFRPDNPLFSSLRLADGWLTVRDAYGFDLACKLVVLSACETGVSAVAPGDELIGLARGFFSAGAPALLVSLWTVDDATTAAFMISFYTQLRAGAPPSAALRSAQCELLRTHAHPFFWSPFVLLGRWN